jgi:hypothetical protein
MPHAVVKTNETKTAARAEMLKAPAVLRAIQDKIEGGQFAILCILNFHD